MDISDKIQGAFNDPSIRLLGQIEISEEEYKKLIEYTRQRILSLQLQTIMPVDVILSVALVHIAIREYSDGNYWDCFRRAIGLNVPSSRTNLIGQVFISTVKHYHLFQIERETGSNNAYVENIKAHAIVPNNYLQGYFDFLFAFYDRNLFRQLPENIDEDYLELSEFFSNTLKDTGDSFVLRNLDNKPAKTYKLLKATRVLFAQGDPDTVSTELHAHLKIIDDYYYDGVMQKTGDRFTAGFSKWISATQVINERSSRKRRSEVFYRSPYFRIDRHTKDVILVIPEQKIRNEDYENKANVEIKSANYNKTIKLSLRRAFGVLVSEEEEIIVPAHYLFDEFIITIRTKNERSFSIPQKDYRIFGEDYDETLKLCKGHNYLLVRKSASIRGAKYSYASKEHADWDEYAYDDINDKSVIYINNTPISTMGGFVVGPNFTHVSSEYELYENEKRIQSAYKHPTVSFRLSKNTVRGSFILVNGKRYPIMRYASSIVELPVEDDTYGITFALEKIINDDDDDDGLYTVYLDEPSKRIKEICSYVLLRSLRCHTEKRRYIFADEALISITGNYDIVPLNCKRADNGCDFILPLGDGKESAEFSLWLDEHDYTLKIPVMVFKYGFERKLQSSKMDYIWHADLKNDFWISMPGATEATVYCELGDAKEEVRGVKVDTGIFRFDLTPLVQAIRENWEDYYCYIKLSYTDNKPRTLTVYKVTNQLMVNYANVIFDKNNQAAVEVKYEGPENRLLIRFTESDNGKTVAERIVHNGTNSFSELSGDNLYTMHLLEITPDTFGFSFKETPVDEPKRWIGAINLNDVSNCIIRLRGASWGGENLKLLYSYVLNNLQKVDEYSYIGSLKERRNTYGGRKYPVTIVAKRVLIECVPDPNHGTLHITSLQTEFEDGVYDPLYYDKWRKRFICSNRVENNDPSRYIALYDEDTVFDTYLRRKK